MSSLSQDDLPRESGHRPRDIEVRPDRAHREQIKRETRTASDKRRLQGQRQARRPARRTNPQTSTYRARFYNLLLGEPPARVLANKPPLFSFSVHRWLYFWVYVICRFHKAEWLNWAPLPRPTIRYRNRRSSKAVQNDQFNVTKAVASFSKKGGVGKTSLIRAEGGLWKSERMAHQVLVQDNNPDRGTLADRGGRTTQHSIMDLIDNIDYVQTAPDFTRYCNEMDEGCLLLASTRPGEFTGELDITPEDFRRIHALTEDFFDVVFYDCGTDAKSLTNQAALVKADVIQLITTPARDSIYQAVMTYVWLCKHPELRSKHVILIVNRKRWWTNLDAIHNFFQETASVELDKEPGNGWRPSSFSVLGVGWDLRLSLGMNFTSHQLRRGVKADLMELLAKSGSLMADSFRDVPESQLTHRQMHDSGRLQLSHQQVVESIRSTALLG